MRVTNNIITQNFLRGMNKALERQNSIQEQLTDGKAIHRPSDNPIKAMRSLRFNTNLSQNEQFTQSLKDAQSWMESTDGAMLDFSSVMISIKELVVRASNGTNPQDAVQTAGQSLDNLINQMIELGNTKLGDRYIFSGQMDKTQPYIREGDTIIYCGDNGKISMPIKMGEATPNEDSVNMTGADIFGDNGTAILEQLIEIKQRLNSGLPEDQKWLSDVGLVYIADAHEAMLQKHAELGTRMSAYEMAFNMMGSQNVIITADIASNEDLDISRAVIDYKTSENVYKAALSVGARIMPVSLLDFLR